MPSINFAAREIHAKIVYYGPGLSGKTTSMKHIFERTDPAVRSRMISLATETERQLFFDFTPLSLATVRGFRVRLHLHTVPGPVFYDVSRQLILKDADGVIFVADSQAMRREANLESLENMVDYLALAGLALPSLPFTLQYNKRDLPDILSPEELDHDLNPHARPRFETTAHQGLGVFDALKDCTRQILQVISRTG